jgi:ribosomal protein L35
LLTGKSRRRKRHLKQSATVTAVEAATIRKLFGGK